MAAVSGIDPARKIRLYIENTQGRPPVYWITEAIYAEGIARHLEAAAHLDTTIAFDTEGRDDVLAEAEVVIGAKLDVKRVARVARRLRWVHSTSAGVENLYPFDWLPQGAVLTNSSGIHAPKAREFAMLALLMLNDQMPLHMTHQREHRWERVYSTPVAGKTAVIIGVGNLGTAVGRGAKHLGLRVIGVDLDTSHREPVDEMVPPSALHEVLPQADFVLVCAPLTPATRGLIGAEELDLLKPTAGFLNMGRAPVVDYEALVERLDTGKIAGAVLDVFYQEPLPFESPLWGTRNLIIMPHVSADDAARYSLNAIEVFLDNVPRYLRGEALRNRVDLEKAY